MSNFLQITDHEKSFYDRLGLPYPTLIPREREQRRLAFRNERSMYTGACELCGKSFISMYHSSKTFPVICRDCFFGDKWDAMSYGRDFDFSRPFFDQFFELRGVVPKQNNGSLNNENSEYTNFTADSKNCYMVIATENSEDCMYCKLCQNDKNCVDCDYVWDSELCYQCTNVSACYHCIGSALIEGCHDCLFSFDLKGCSDCCFCHNLRNKKYCIFNKEYSEDEYRAKIEEFNFGSYEGFEKGRAMLLDLVRKAAIHKASDLINCENCIGDHLKNSKNMYLCFDLQDSEECACGAEGDAIHSMDVNNVYYKPEWCNELISALQTTQTVYSMFCYYTSDVLYSDYCFNSHDLFGCVGLKHKEYCILNKQYSKEEYIKLKLKIIEDMKIPPTSLLQEKVGINGAGGEWGQFFPAYKSPFGYNETVAFEYYPLTREEALKQGFKWRDPDKRDFMQQTYGIPDLISDVKDDIIGQILACTNTGKNFKILKEELAFYRDQNLPVPRKSPDERHKDRMQFRNPRQIWMRNCHKCNKTVHSTYAPERTEKVYCEACYNEEIY